MLHTIFPEEMKRVERRAMENTGVTSLTLMERAALYVANAARPYLSRGGELLLACGPGRNGGDGLAAVRMLLEKLPNLNVTVWKLSGTPAAETAEQWERLTVFGSRVHTVSLNGNAPQTPPNVSCVIDALFGTGLSRPLESDAVAAIRALNEGCAPVVAVDIPSGLNGATGYAPALGDSGNIMRATVTVTFHRPKIGLFLGDGPDCSGRVIVANIGIAPEWDDAPGLTVLSAGDALLAPRRRNTHKGDYGRVLLLAGSFGMAGAAAVCATAALRAGAGLVTVACPSGITPTVQALCPCATCLPLPETDTDEAWRLLLPALRSADALAAGCGLGREALAVGLMKRLVPWLCENDLPAVLDADALNLLADAKEIPRLPTRVVLTPHLGEAARLLKRPTAEVVGNQVEAARNLYAKYGAPVVLKSATSVIITDDGEAISVFGTPAMAKGGSGDALAGVLAAMLAGRETYGQNGTRLIQTACALHGLAGELAARKCGERGALATDLCDALGQAPSVVPRGWVETVGMAEQSDERAETAVPVPGMKVRKDADGQEYRVHPCVSAVESALRSVLGRKVRVTVDRPLGSHHPEHRDIIYRLNYGYVADVLAADNEWQDAYIFGVAKPVEYFEGEVVAVIHRLNDVEDKWVVAEPGIRPDAAEIRAQTAFAEDFFQNEIFLE